ncbi:MAG: hypothetical protein Q8R91_04405 [Candidatus Omnitrophota bacterium]|nr:hypothetical protein [Candidatus Omnitrophota bacterium]
MRAQAWRTVRISTRAVAVLATLVAAPTPATHPVPSKAQSTNSEPTPAFASDVDLSTRGAMQDSQLRATLRGLSLEQQLPAYVVVAHDPQWLAGTTIRVSPPARSMRKRDVQRQAKVIAAIRRVLAVVIRSLHRPRVQKATSNPRPLPVALARDLRGQEPTEPERFPQVFAQLGTSLAGSHAFDNPSRWLWSPLPITDMTAYNVGNDRRMDWVPWRPRGPPALRPQRFELDVIR